MRAFVVTGAFAFSLTSSAALADKRIDGLLSISPEWHESIDAGLCLTDTGFAECTSKITEAGGLVYYVASTINQSRLLTKFHIFSEECRGAATPQDISGWCGKRDEVRLELEQSGVCLRNDGFRLCPAAFGD